MLRCDASPRLSEPGGEHDALAGRAAPDEPAATGWFAEQPATRMCAMTAGSRANAVANVMTHRIGDARQIEAALARRLPADRVLERQLTLRTVKLVGHLLGAQGRNRGYVPIDPWQGTDEGAGGVVPVPV